MHRFIFTIVLCCALGFGYYVFSPFWTNTVVSESSPDVGPLSVVKTASFSGFDEIHKGSGTINFMKIGTRKYMRFEDDFNVTNGPDLYVGFGKNNIYIKGSEIAKLKGNIGAQNYGLPDDFNFDEIDEVWVWCKIFSTPFGKAVFK